MSTSSLVRRKIPSIGSRFGFELGLCIGVSENKMRNGGKQLPGPGRDAGCVHLDRSLIVSDRAGGPAVRDNGPAE
jgi:hypothetical protein